jgi:hypothetical protein
MRNSIATDLLKLLEFWRKSVDSKVISNVQDGNLFDFTPIYKTHFNGTYEA